MYVCDKQCSISLTTANHGTTYYGRHNNTSNIFNRAGTLHLVSSKGMVLSTILVSSCGIYSSMFMGLWNLSISNRIDLFGFYYDFLL